MLNKLLAGFAKALFDTDNTFDTKLFTSVSFSTPQLGSTFFIQFFFQFLGSALFLIFVSCFIQFWFSNLSNVDFMDFTFGSKFDTILDFDFGSFLALTLILCLIHSWFPLWCLAQFWFQLLFYFWLHFGFNFGLDTGSNFDPIFDSNWFQILIPLSLSLFILFFIQNLELLLVQFFISNVILLLVQFWFQFLFHFWRFNFSFNSGSSFDSTFGF